MLCFKFESGTMLLRITVSLVLCIFLVSCGQAGALYRPDSNENQPVNAEAE